MGLKIGIQLLEKVPSGPEPCHEERIVLEPQGKVRSEAGPIVSIDVPKNIIELSLIEVIPMRAYFAHQGNFIGSVKRDDQVGVVSAELCQGTA